MESCESEAENVVTEEESGVLGQKPFEISRPNMLEDEEGILKCSYCDFKTKRPCSMTKHSSSRKICSLCSKIFCGKYAKRQLESHQKKHKAKQKRHFVCVHCHKQFPIKSKLQRHLLWSKCGRKTPPKTMQKDQNGIISYKEMSDLEVKSFQVVEDDHDMSFSSPENLVTEEDSDVENNVTDKESDVELIVTDEESDYEVSKAPVSSDSEKLFRCANCEFESEIPRIIKRHMNSFRECSQCSEVFCGKESKRQYESHQKKHKVKMPFMCVHCHKLFAYKSGLKYHLLWSKCGRTTPPRTVQMDKNGVFTSREMSDSEIESFKMVEDDNSKSFLPPENIVTEEDLDVKNNVTDEESEVEDIVTESDALKQEPLDISTPAMLEDEEGILKCSNCDFKTKRPCSMAQHSSSRKICTLCSKIFCGKYAKRQLESHQKKHKAKQKIPFVCVHCKKQFSSKSKLKAHLVWSKCGRKTPPKTILKDEKGDFRKLSDLEVESFQMTQLKLLQPTQTSAVFIPKPAEDKVDVNQELRCENDPLAVGLEERLRYAHSIQMASKMKQKYK